MSLHRIDTSPLCWRHAKYTIDSMSLHRIDTNLCVGVTQSIGLIACLYIALTRVH